MAITADLSRGAHLLLATGAAMFGVTSVGGFDHFLAVRLRRQVSEDPGSGSPPPAP